MPITIPDPSLRGLKELVSLEDGELKSLFSSLSSAVPALYPAQLANSLLESGVTIGKGVLRDILGSLISVYGVRKRADVSIERFTADLSQGEDEDGDEAFDEEEAERLVRVLPQFLGLDAPLGITAKANGVLIEHQRTYCSARVLTDLRPIFSDDASAVPRDTVMVHTLRLSYHEGSAEPKDIFVALDSEDLRNLKAVISRAETKATAVSKMLEKAQVTLLDVDAGEGS